MHERRNMLARPPHILVTTPESLYILLTAEKSRAILRNIETVIVDEIHAVADDKRGAHLALSLERLEALLERPPVRIGLSATQKPIEAVAQFLAGNRPAGARDRRYRPRPAHGPRRRSAAERTGAGRLQRNVGRNLRPHRRARAAASLDAGLRQHAAACPSASRIIWPSAWAKEAVAAHHGSLSRKLRLAAERKLKAGEMRVLVATASLELGIDIGFVDLVCQIGSPRSIAVALQRIGRAGHWRGAIPKGRIFATTRDELLECAALVRSVRSRRPRPPGDSRQRRWTFWRSRSWPRARRKSGARTISSP